jgi:hypothetical protein
MFVFNPAEQYLLDAAPRQFPMIAAASAALKRCGTCGHKNVNIHAMLCTAATKYRNDPEFSDFIRKFSRLPVIIGGILVE